MTNDLRCKYCGMLWGEGWRDHSKCNDMPALPTPPESPKPREWHINTRDRMISPIFGVVEYKGTRPSADDIVHVIEYAAYERLQLECAEWKAKSNFMMDSAQQNARERDSLQAALNHPTSERMGHLIRERDELRLQCEQKAYPGSPGQELLQCKQERDQLRALCTRLCEALSRYNLTHKLVAEASALLEGK